MLKKEAAEETALEAVKFTSRRALVTLTRQEGQNTLVFIPSSADVSIGDTVRLKLTFSDCNKSFYISGRVNSAQSAVMGRPAGFELLISMPAERRAWSHAYAFCSRNQEPARRYSASIRCSIDTGTDKFSGFIRDLSMTGAFVVTRPKSSLTVGTPVTIDVKTGLFGLGSKRFKAEVMWLGTKNETMGIGAQFIEGAQPVLELIKRHGLRPGNR